MTDPRPRPQYGEYATPEQQAAAMGLSSLPPHAAPPPFGQKPLAQPPPGVAVAPHSMARVPGAVAGHPWDRVVTTLLLTYGLVNVLVSSFQFTDLASVVNSQIYEPRGIGTYVGTALSAQLGTVIVVSQVVIFIATAALAVSRLRRGRVSFWVPIVGALVAGAIAAVCISTLLFADPVFTAWLSTNGGL